MSEVHISETGGFNLERANKLLAGLGDNGSSLFKGVYSALRRASTSAVARAGRFASSEYAISAGFFKSHVRVKNMIKGGHEGVTEVTILFAGNVIPLIQFKTKYGRDGGVHATVKKGGGSLDSAFIANAGHGTGVYERTTSRRLPIEQKYGPSAAHMMMDENVIDSMDQHIVEVFNTRMEHEITRILNGW